MNVSNQPSIGVQTGSVVLEKGHLSSVTRCKLLSLIGTNTGPDQFIQIHDAIAAPAEAAVPLFVFPVGANQLFSLDVPVKLLTGLYVCNSTTAATKTAGGNNCWFLTRHN